MEKQKFETLLKFFFLAFSVIALAVLLFPWIYAAKFNTILDLFYFLDDAQKNFEIAHSLNILIGTAIILIFLSAAVIANILRMFKDSDLVLESWCTTLIVVLLALFSVFYTNFIEGIGTINGLKSDVFGYAWIVYFALWLGGAIIFAVLAAIDNTVFASYSKPLRQIKLDKDEKELHKIQASKLYGYSGELTVTSKRLFFSGKSLFTDRVISVSIPHEKVLFIKNPRESNLFSRVIGHFYLASSLNILYSDHKGNTKKAVFGPQFYNEDKAYLGRLMGVFEFVYNLYSKAK